MIVWLRVKLSLDIKGADTKNLFLTDKDETRHFLLVVPHDKKVDLKAFARAHDLPKLAFGTAEKMKEYLGVEPGAVTILGLINDGGGKVELFVDQEVWAHDFVQCHPLVNTATLVIARDDLRIFVQDSGHELKVVPVPARS